MKALHKSIQSCHSDLPATGRSGTGRRGIQQTKPGVNDSPILQTPDCVACLWWSFPQNGNRLYKSLDFGLRVPDGCIIYSVAQNSARLETVKLLAGKKAIEKTRPGHYIQPAAGWKQK